MIFKLLGPGQESSILRDKVYQSTQIILCAYRSLPAAIPLRIDGMGNQDDRKKKRRLGHSRRQPPPKANVIACFVRVFGVGGELKAPWM